MAAMDKHSSLLDQFVIYQENEVLWIWPQVSYSEQLVLFVLLDTVS